MISASTSRSVMRSISFNLVTSVVERLFMYEQTIAQIPSDKTDRTSQPGLPEEYITKEFVYEKYF